MRGLQAREHGFENVDGLRGREPLVLVQEVAQGDARTYSMTMYATPASSP